MTHNGDETGQGEAGRPERQERSALEEWADTIETTFNGIDQSLTNPATAAAYQQTLNVWERVLQGSHANGVITADQLTELTTVLHGMREAPRLI